MDFIIKNIKEISYIITGIFAISIFFYNVSIIDGIYGFNKKDNKLNIISNMLLLILGILAGLTIYILSAAKLKFARNILDMVCAFFNISHYEFWLIIFFIYLLFISIICLKNIYKLDKLNKIIMFTKQMPEKDNHTYIINNVLILFITSMMVSFLIGSTPTNNFFATRIMMCLTYMILFIMSGIYNSLKLTNKLKIYRVYFSKSVYFPEFEKYENYLDVLLISESKDEYVVKPNNQPKLHIKKSLVDMLQPQEE